MAPRVRDGGLTIRHTVPALQRLLAKKQRQVRDFRPFFEGPAESIIRRWFQRQWQTKGADGGHPWPKLSPVTLALKTRRGRARMGILRDSNRLWASLTKRRAPESVVVVTPRSILVGTTVRQPGDGRAYPILMQRGYTLRRMFGHKLRRPRKVPARVIVPSTLPDHWSAEMATALGAFFDREA